MVENETRHIPVLLDEVLRLLNPQAGQTFVDGTLGGGGHTRKLAELVGPTGRIYSLDRDRAAVAAAQKTLADLPVTPLWADYRDLPQVLTHVGIGPVDGVLIDIGLSSDQLADDTRGFSFLSEGPLDLRFDIDEGAPAADLVNRADETELANLIYRYGEERLSRRIARAVVERRRAQPFVTARDLADVVRRAVPRSADADRIHPATRTFQALRIAVNDELGALETFLKVAPDCVRAGGRVAIITFHSLEDRLVKHAFRDDPRYDVSLRKPVTAGDDETARNPRSRSAKLRAASIVADPPPYPFK